MSIEHVSFHVQAQSWVHAHNSTNVINVSIVINNLVNCPTTLIQTFPPFNYGHVSLCLHPHGSECKNT